MAASSSGREKTWRRADSGKRGTASSWQSGRCRPTRMRWKHLGRSISRWAISQPRADSGSLTERSGSEMEEAMAGFEERWGGNLGEKLKVVPLNGKVEDDPPAARERLRALGEWARRGGLSGRGRRLSRSRNRAMIRLVLVGGSWERYWPSLGPGLWLLGIAAAVYLLAEWLL
jgi:hypothetical protein